MAPARADSVSDAPTDTENGRPATTLSGAVTFRSGAVASQIETITWPACSHAVTPSPASSPARAGACQAFERSPMTCAAGLVSGSRMFPLTERSSSEVQ